MAFSDAGRDLQQQLVLHADYRQEFEILKAIVQASNQNNFIQPSILQGLTNEGKKRKVKVVFYPPTCDPEGSCSDGVCDDKDNVIEPTSDLLEIDNCIASKVYKLKMSDVRDIDGDYNFSRNARMQILSTLNGLRKALATKVAANVKSNVGKFQDGSTSKLISFTDPTDASIRPLGMWEIEREYQDMNLTQPYLIGGQDVFLWKKAVEAGGLNAKGIQTNRMRNSNLFYSPLMNDAFSDPSNNHVVALDPNAVKFITYNKNVGMFGTDLDSVNDFDRLFRTSGNYLRGTFVDPVTGIAWDLDVKYNDCDEEYQYQLRLEWDIFYMPNDVCLEHDVNGILDFKTCLPAAVDCPTT